MARAVSAPRRGEVVSIDQWDRDFQNLTQCIAQINARFNNLQKLTPRQTSHYQYVLATQIQKLEQLQGKLSLMAAQAAGVPAAEMVPTGGVTITPFAGGAPPAAWVPVVPGQYALAAGGRRRFGGS